MPTFIFLAVSGKKETNMFYVISFITLGRFWWNLVYGIVSWIDLLQNRVKVFHLARIASLHYLVKLEKLISHVLPQSCQ